MLLQFLAETEKEGQTALRRRLAQECERAEQTVLRLRRVQRLFGRIRIRATLAEECVTPAREVLRRYLPLS